MDGQFGAFAQGVNHEQATSRVTPHPYSPSSVLTEGQLYRSPIGMAQKDAGRRLVGGGMLPTANAMSSDTYLKSRPWLGNKLSV